MYFEPVFQESTCQLARAKMKTMENRSAQIETICECIDHCFAFAMWCDDFAKHVDPEDMMAGLNRAFELVSDATRLQSFLALRKLDDFLAGVKPKPDDLIAANLGIDVPSVLGGAGNTFLSTAERDNINKGVAHLTAQLTLDADSEVDLQAILKRSMPAFSSLVTALRKIDARKEATYWLDRTEALIGHVQQPAKYAG
jgi:hypothetical protein